MTNIIEQYEQEQMNNSNGQPKFQTGDTIAVGFKIREGDRERIQTFQGVVIAMKKKGLRSNVTIRKTSYGEGVERTFPLYSKQVDSIKLIRTGKVRRSKIYYFRNLSSKKAKLKEDSRR
jgi:large subunit ribosomal protein L19